MFVYTKIVAKRLRATTFVIAKLKEYQKSFRISMIAIIFSQTVLKNLSWDSEKKIKATINIRF